MNQLQLFNMIKTKIFVGMKFYITITIKSYLYIFNVLLSLFSLYELLTLSLLKCIVLRMKPHTHNEKLKLLLKLVGNEY